MKKAGAKPAQDARRRLFLLIDVLVRRANGIPGIDVSIVRRETARIVRSDEEMVRLIGIMRAPHFPGDLEDRFFLSAFHNIRAYAIGIGAISLSGAIECPE